MIEYKFQFYDKDPKTMTIEELRTEIRCQKALNVPLQIGIWHFRKARYLHEKKLETEKERRIGWRKSQIRQIDEKIGFLDNLAVASKGYKEYLQTILTEKYRSKQRAMQHRRQVHSNPRYKYKQNVHKYQMIEATRRYNKAKIEAKQSDPNINPYGWDKDKLIMVANDRGYMTKESITLAISSILNVEWKTAERLIENGKLSWGRVLLLGAFFEMTPKEFCDIFLSGYFEEVAPGEFRANQDSVEERLEFLSQYQKYLLGRGGPVQENYDKYKEMGKRLAEPSDESGEFDPKSSDIED